MRKLTAPEIEFQKQTGLKLGRQTYNSGVAAIYQIGPTKLAKIASESYGPSTSDMIGLLKYLIEAKNQSVVKVHKFGSFELPQPDSDKIIKYYYYVMDKLLPLPRRGRSKVVNEIYRVLAERHKTRRDMPTQVKSFIRNAKRLKYSYNDIHEYNVMQNKKGTMKFIDLESFVFYY